MDYLGEEEETMVRGTNHFRRLLSPMLVIGRDMSFWMDLTSSVVFDGQFDLEENLVEFLLQPQTVEHSH